MFFILFISVVVVDLCCVVSRKAFKESFDGNVNQLIFLKYCFWLIKITNFLILFKCLVSLDFLCRFSRNSYILKIMTFFIKVLLVSQQCGIGTFSHDLILHFIRSLFFLYLIVKQVQILYYQLVLSELLEYCCCWSNFLN